MARCMSRTHHTIWPLLTFAVGRIVESPGQCPPRSTREGPLVSVLAAFGTMNGAPRPADGVEMGAGTGTPRVLEVETTPLALEAG